MYVCDFVPRRDICGEPALSVLTYNQLLGTYGDGDAARRTITTHATFTAVRHV